MKYHPDIELLLKYSSGQLDPSLAVAIGLHQQQCQTCQQVINDLETVGGETLQAAATESNEMDPIILCDFERLMEDIAAKPIEQEPDELAQYDQLAVAKSDLGLLDQLANQRFEELKWQRVGARIWRSSIAMNDPAYQVELLKFSANVKIPKHTHRGNEYTLVLQGDFSDQSDNYHQGEFIVQDQQHEHQPVAGKNGCVCLAITDAPLKFTGTFGPVLNWLNR